MRFLVFLFFAASFFFAGFSVWAHDASEIKTAACSDSFATTFVRLDKTSGGGIMYGVFYHHPTISNSYLQPAPRLQYVVVSQAGDPDVYRTEADSEAQDFKGTLSLAFPNASLDTKGDARVSYLDSSGDTTWSDVQCELSY